MFPTLLPSQWDSLEAEVSLTEVKKALFDMKPLKAPGPDGLHALFYQSQWETVSQSLHEMVVAIFNGHDMHASFNNTSIALIPKTDSPTTIKDFRPIGLCPVVYKVVTKILSNRLQPLMPLLITPF